MADQNLDKTQEHRRFRRISFVNAVQVVSEDIEGVDASSWESRCIDISILGMLLEVPKDFPLTIGTPFEARLILEDGMTIEIPCTLVHIEGRKAGFRAEMMSIDSMNNLRRLLELNLVDPEKIERDLGVLIEQSA